MFVTFGIVPIPNWNYVIGYCDIFTANAFKLTKHMYH